jgi:hypothetical protein
MVERGGREQRGQDRECGDDRRVSHLVHRGHGELDCLSPVGLDVVRDVLDHYHRVVGEEADGKDPRTRTSCPREARRSALWQWGLAPEANERRG